MTTRHAQGKATRRQPSVEDDDAQPRKPSWRDQAPAKPRKRVKRKQVTAPSGTGRASGRTGGGARGSSARGVGLPSRETVVMSLRVAALLVTFIAVTVGLIYLLRWPLLAVGRGSTEIGGLQRITPEEIYVGSGVDGRNVLLLGTAEIAEGIKQVPGVARVDVHLRLPNRVIIDVQEHAPLVAWQSITTTVWLASDGATVPQAGLAPPLTFTDQSGGRLDRDATLRKLILEHLVALHAAQPALTQFFYADQPGLYYRALEGWDVWLGEGGPINVKLALADAAGKDIAQQGARPKVIDVRQSERNAMWW